MTTSYGSGMDIDVTPATYNATIDICAAKSPQSPIHIVIALIVVILIICNFMILTAVALSWRILRQNIVYRYLISCLVSVVCFCALSMYEQFNTLNHIDDNHIIGGVLQRYNSSDPSHRTLMLQNAYRKGTIPALFLIMQINIAALIYAVSDNIAFVGRFGEQNVNAKSQKICNLRKNDIATILLVIAWIGPLILSLPVAFGWNCIDRCLCLPMYRNENTCLSSPDRTKVCSRIWQPMTRGYVLATFATYIIVMFLMFIMLFSTVRKFYKTHAIKEPPLNTGGLACTQKNKASCINSHGKGTEQQKNLPMVSESNVSKFQHDKLIFKFSVKKSTSQNKRAPSPLSGKSNTRPPLHDTIKLLIVLTVLLFLSDTPVMLLMFADIFLEDATTINTFLSAMALTFIYAACLPFIMLKYMLGLRKACVSTLMKFPCLRTTTVVRKKSKRIGNRVAEVNEEYIEAGKTTVKTVQTEVNEKAADDSSEIPQTIIDK